MLDVRQDELVKSPEQFVLQTNLALLDFSRKGILSALLMIISQNNGALDYDRGYVIGGKRKLLCENKG